MRWYCIQLFIVLVLSEYPQSDACTIFNAGKNGKILVGNTEDAPFDNALIWFFPAKEGKYGGVYFNFESWGNPFPQGGMNEQGLFYDWGALPARTDMVFPSDLKSVDGFLCMKMLEECATLDEAIALYRAYRDPALDSGHIMIVDKSGNSAIIAVGAERAGGCGKTGFFPGHDELQYDRAVHRFCLFLFQV